MRATVLSQDDQKEARGSAAVVLNVLDVRDIEASQSAEILGRELAARGCKIFLDDRPIPGELKLAEPPTERQACIDLGARWLATGEVQLRVRSVERRVNLEDAVEETMRCFK